MITEWISVNDCLPEDGTWAIFTNGKVASVERFKVDAENHFYPPGIWFDFDRATHWMPLPKLPNDI